MPDDLEYPPPAAESHSEGTWAQKVSWVLYDWGNSGFGMIITGVMFSTYFSKVLAPRHLVDGQIVRGIELFGTFVPSDGIFALMTATAALLVTVSAPLLGAIADMKGWTKRLLMIHAIAGSFVAMFAFFLREGMWVQGAIIYVIASYFFSASLTFYNAFLPRLTAPHKQGRLSGAGFAAGYVGGGVALIVAAFVMPTTQWGLLLGGAWWLFFSLPAFAYLREFEPVHREPVQGSLVLAGFRQIGDTFRNLRRYRMLFLFLLAFLTYSNGIDSVINLAPAYATQTLTDLQEGQNEKIFLAVQFVAFPGALLCGYLADKIGNKPVIVVTLIIWCLAVAVVPLISTTTPFFIVACVIGLVLGGVQSSSRALMAKLAPREIHNEAFGFFSVSGKAVSVLGPLVYFGIVTTFGSRWGVLAVLPFLVGGLLILMRVKEPNLDRPAKLAATQ